MAEFDKRFFESTRGRIVKSLRGGNKTVNDLAAELALTDNAIRAHLLSLERDRLVEQAGTIKGHRKPHFIYSLTADARKLFPKSYDSLLNRILSVLKARFKPSAVTEVLEESGRQIGSGVDAGKEATLEEKVEKALSALAELGGSAEAISESGQTIIRSSGCPFAEVVSEHPEVCKMAESMIEEIVGCPVEEHCDRSSLPKCCFAVHPA